MICVRILSPCNFATFITVNKAVLSCLEYIWTAIWFVHIWCVCKLTEDQ